MLCGQAFTFKLGRCCKFLIVAFKIKQSRIAYSIENDLESIFFVVVAVARMLCVRLVHL